MRTSSSPPFDERLLGELFSIQAASVKPALTPEEMFAHHSIPAFDEGGDPAVEAGASIGSNKTLLTEPCLLVSKLNPRKPRVKAVDPTDQSIRHCASTEFIAYLPISREVSLRFFEWLLGGVDFQGRLRRVATGSTNSHVRARPSETLGWPVAVPPLPEQRLIAQILDTLDESIRNTEQLIAKLNLIKQGLLHDLLTRGIDENGELRDPDRHPEQFQNSPLGKIPREWEISTVSREFEVGSGFTLGPDRSPRGHPWPYLRVANVFRDRLALEDVALIEARNSELRGRQLLEGDLLVVEGHANPGEIGRCGMATCAVRGLTFQNHLFRLRPSRLESPFAHAWMNSSWVRAYWRREAASSSGLYTINQAKLRRLLVPVPSEGERTRIGGSIQSLTTLARREESYLAKLRLLKAGLMEDLLTGRVRVTPLLEADP